MNISTAIKRIAAVGLSVVMSTGIIVSAQAAPGAISGSPLFLTNYPQANIFFMLDNSGSMDWDVMVASGTSGLPSMGGWTGNYYVLPAWNNNYDEVYYTYDPWCTSGARIGCFPYVTPSDAALTNNSWRVRNYNYNSMYYNPAVRYTAWDGTDASGNPMYGNATATAAVLDPGNPTQGTINLTQTITFGNYTSDAGWFQDSIFPAHYYTWADTDTDGVVDGNDAHTRVNIVPATASYPKSAARTDCTGATCTYAQEIQNFANWFSYHRRREYVTKFAVSKLINESQVRVGLSAIHNNIPNDTVPSNPDHDHDNIGTPIADVDDISTPIDATARANKITLLGKLADINSWRGTPLLYGLRNAGNYYEVGVTTGLSTIFGSTPNPSSPILSSTDGGQCQQNFTILMSDGFWNTSNPDIGDTDSNGNTAFDGASYADGISHTLADIAMDYYERDLATSLSNKVPVTAGVDDNDQQHMVTYSVAFGINGNASCNPSDKTTSVTSQGWPEVCSNPGYTGTGSGWPNPIDAEDLDRVDDMRHAAWNGRGLFLSASSPQTLVDSMTSALSDIGDRAGSAAAVSFNSTSLQTNTLVYQAKFDSAGWNGDLRAVQLVTTATGAVVLGSEVWKAGGLLDARGLVSNPRQIATHNGTQGIAFEWPANYTSPTSSELSTAQINDFLVNAPFLATTTTPAEIIANQAFGVTVVDYLYGDDSNEGTNTGDFRERNGHRLGDIVHSGPFYVGPPSTPYPNLIEASHPYSAFASTWSNRAGRVYVGANDGMLHVFDSNGGSSAGQEMFAYIPGFLFSDQPGDGLHHLTEQGYVHDYFVDLSPIAADVFIDSSSSSINWGSTGWKTAVIGAVRGGGKGIFVLDATNPANLTASNAASVIKMEFTHADLGYTFSDIQVGKMNNGKWAAVFGNGYNNTGDGTAKLFIVYLDGSTPHIISTGVGTIVGSNCADPGSDCNGMSTPAIADINGDGTIDRIYAGDLKGNMWVLNVPATTLASSTSSVVQPLFTACEGGTATCTTTSRQPITSKPALARHPTQRSGSTYPNIMVYFGTGQYLATGDNTTTQLQEFYGVWDRGTTNVKSDKLIEQTISESTTTVAGETIAIRTLSNNAVSYTTSTSSDFGWRIELPTSKERNVVAPVALGDVVFFNTMVPETDVCSQGGYGWLMAVDQYDGSEPEFVVIDVNNDGVFDGADTVGGANVSGTKSDGISTESRFLPAGSDRMVRVTSDSTGGIDVTGVQTGPADPAGRMSWTLLEY